MEPRFGSNSLSPLVRNCYTLFNSNAILGSTPTQPRSNPEAQAQYMSRCYQHHECKSTESYLRTSGSARYTRCRNSYSIHCQCCPCPCSSHHRTRCSPLRCHSQSGPPQSDNAGWTARWRRSRWPPRRSRWRLYQEDRTQAADRRPRAGRYSRTGCTCMPGRHRRRRCLMHCSSTLARPQDNSGWHSPGCESN